MVKVLNAIGLVSLAWLILLCDFTSINYFKKRRYIIDQEKKAWFISDTHTHTPQ